MRGTAVVGALVLAMTRGLVAGAAPAPPLAQAPPATNEAARVAARAKVQEGARVFERGQMADALARFDEAYALFPSALIQYNRAQALRGMGRNIEAADALEQFLAEAPAAGRDKRAEAQQDLAELRRKLGSIRIACAVAGAMVVLDGREIGETPLAKPVRVDVGKRDLTVRKAGRQTFHASVDVTPQSEQKVEVALEAVPAPIELNRTPAPVGVGLESDAKLHTVVERPALEATTLSHAGQIGLFARADTKLNAAKGVVAVAGVSYGMGARFELALAALVGYYKGADAEARLYFADGVVKPLVSLGVPAFFSSGAQVGLQPAAGVLFDLGAHVGVALEASAAYFPSAPAGTSKLLFLPSVGTQVRF